ncbi:hypothetical protein [uncultured Methanofollis sp.]|uniref:hypothetical protein n=1 Tax=uncultured Methanofollis sp. TaxID=262500 RepID=UPI0026389AF7|nr:hypothetical protein [uncultured Methanofollis sp.]
MRPFPIFTVLLLLVITLVVFVPHFPHLVGAVAGGAGVDPDRALAAFIVVMFIAAIILSVLAVREIYGLVCWQVSGERGLKRT